MVMHHHKAECHADKLVHCVQCHNKSFCNQNMTISVVSSKLLVSLQPNLVCQYSIISQMSCGKMGLLHPRSRSQQRFKMSVNVCPDDIFSVCLIVSTQYLLSHSAIFFLPNLVLWCIIMSRFVMQKNWFTVFNVKVTARAYVIKI